MAIVTRVYMWAVIYFIILFLLLEGVKMLGINMKGDRTGRGKADAVERYDPLPLAEKLGFNAHQVNWTVRENAEAAKSLVKSIEKNVRELTDGSAGLQELTGVARSLEESARRLAELCSSRFTQAREGKKLMSEAKTRLVQIAADVLTYAKSAG